jgi:hypothetical protein
MHREKKMMCMHYLVQLVLLAFIFRLSATISGVPWGLKLSGLGLTCDVVVLVFIKEQHIILSLFLTCISTKLKYCDGYHVQNFDLVVVIRTM